MGRESEREMSGRGVRVCVCNTRERSCTKLILIFSLHAPYL